MCPKEHTIEEQMRIYAVKRYILNHLEEAFIIGGLAKKAAVGEQKFKDGFYQLFGMNVGAYIHEARMKTGKFMLMHTDKSIKEIGLLCGYSKARNFSSAYKKYFGVRPGEDRS